MGGGRGLWEVYGEERLGCVHLYIIECIGLDGNLCLQQ